MEEPAMFARLLVLLCLFVPNWPASAQVSLLDQLNQELAPLSRLERLYVLKLAENKITEQLRAIATDPVTKTDGPIWLMKVASFSYGTLTLLLEHPFPDISAVYRDRTELYSDVVRGKLQASEVEARERENETVKQRVLDQQLSALQKVERPPTESRTKTLIDLGNRLGLMIATMAKSGATKNSLGTDNGSVGTSSTIAPAIVNRQQTSDCFSKFTKYDVCAKAKEIQGQAASTLPMRVNAEMTFSQVVAIGPLVMFVIVWQIDSNDLQVALKAQSMTAADLKLKMDQQTKTMICGQQVTAAFVRLRGKIQYAYRTQDGVPVHAPMIEMC
jgi:hypothetical protein